MAKRFFTPIDLTGTINENISAPERTMKWSDGEGTIEVGLKGGNVKLAVGQEEVALCYNGTGNTLYDGQVVYINGAQGQRPRIALASASSESTSSKTFGVVTETINNGAEGFVCTFGIVRGINTSTFTSGSALWLSTNAGQITSTMPTAPNHAVFIGYCLKSHANAGEIFVKIQNGYELQELHNVSIIDPENGEVLQYNSSTGLWENGAFQIVIPEGASYTAGTDKSLFFNTTTGKMAIYDEDTWREFAYESSFITLDGGNASTTDFINTIDGGNASTEFFVNQYDGGSAYS